MFRPEIFGSHDILFITLESLRYDVATQAHLPQLKQLLPPWQARHTPASFTYAAHQAFFSGFLPTPLTPGQHPRLFASTFERSRTIKPQYTFVFEEASLPEALSNRGYHTVCIGGTQFFNPARALGAILPGLFQTTYWHPAMGVARKTAIEAQLHKAHQVLAAQSQDQRLFLFINLTATHAPTHIFHPSLKKDSPATQQAALESLDQPLAELLQRQAQRHPTLLIICADHGEAFGEEGYYGHRLGHSSVWTVPYLDCILGENYVTV